VADATASMAAMDTQRKAGIQDKFDATRQHTLANYANTMANVYNQRQNILGQKMEQWDNFANSGAGIGSAIMGLGNLFKK
jgi:hexokinase